MSFTVLIAPSGFKESLDVADVVEAMAEGVTRALPDAVILKAPMVDGGEGFTRGLVSATGGTLHPARVTGPVGAPVETFVGVLGGPGPRTVVLEMAAAAGLSLVPRDRRDPMTTTSHGVGELIRAALDLSPERILIGCGDSGINDGGVGMLQALGGRALDRTGRDLARGGGALMGLDRIDLAGLDPRLATTRLDAAVNWHNVLTGPRGVARVFAPQKGATPEQVAWLEQGLETYARVIARDFDLDIATTAGGGASGGLGAGLMLIGTKLHPRFDIVMDYLAFDRMLTRADLVLTAEGSLDGQTPLGKIPAEVGRRARAAGVPVVALAGTIGKGATANFDHGIDAFASILKRPCTLEEAIPATRKLLVRATDDAMRMILVGARLSGDTRRAA